MTLPFNRPLYIGLEDEYVLQAIRSSEKMSGNGPFSRQCHRWFEQSLPCKKAMLTPSCTAALEMAAILIGIRPGDEVIMPSYTFVSTANAFVLRGAKIVFVDVQPKTMNIDVSRIEAAITPRTRAIVPVHYAGIGCDMDAIMSLADQYNLYVIEDAAQGMMSSYKGRALGTIGHLAAYSFHDTKNYTSGGEGGLLIVNDERFVERAEIIREKGTNRSQFFRGQVDKYTWMDMGSSYLPSELQAAYLWGQLEHASEINANRRATWNAYYQQLKPLASAGHIDLPHVPNNCAHNAHMFYLKVESLAARTALVDHLKQDDIVAVFHYVPLHSSPAGKKFGRFVGEDRYTTTESERLVRLPMWYGMDASMTSKVTVSIKTFCA